MENEIKEKPLTALYRELESTFHTSPHKENPRQHLDIKTYISSNYTNTIVLTQGLFKVIPISY